MVLQHKMRTSLLDLLESHAGGNVPKKVVQVKLPTLPPTQVLQLDPANKKRKRDQKGKEVVEERKNLPPKEVEPYKGGDMPGSRKRDLLVNELLCIGGVTTKLKFQLGPPP